MRDGLDRYQIRGARGLRKQFHTLLGDMMDNYEVIQQVQADGGDVWPGFCAAMDFMIKLATLREKYTPAMEMVKQFLPFWPDEAPDQAAIE